MDSLVNYVSEDDGAKKHVDDRIISDTYSSSKRGKIKDVKRSEPSNKEIKQKVKDKHRNYHSVENENNQRNKKDTRSDRVKSKSSRRVSGSSDYYRHEGRIGHHHFNIYERKNDIRDNRRKSDSSRSKNEHQHSKNHDIKSRKQKYYDNDNSRYTKQKKRSESPKPKGSTSSQNKKSKYSDRNELGKSTNSRHNGTKLSRELKEETTKSVNLSTHRSISFGKTHESKNIVPHDEPKINQSNQITIAQSTETTIPTSLPSYYNRNIINPNKYAEQVQKRKLIWGAKKTEDSTGKWDNAKFSQDTDGKVQSKFMRLMGIKSAPKIDSDANNETSVLTNDNNSSIKSKTSDIKTREHMFSTMEQQYEVARQVTHTMRGVGLGFGSQPRQF